MKYRELGKTGRMVSVMGYGCGGFWGTRLFDEKNAISLVHEAIDQGVTFFDTGASYSGGNAEVRLSKALKGKDRSGLMISTKAGTVIQGRKLTKDYSRQSIFSQVESSLKKLSLDSLPLLQLHGLPDKNLEYVLETLILLKEQGKVQLTGVSCDGQDVEKSLEYDIFDTIMLTYNLIEKHALRQVELAHDKGCGVLIKSPLCHTLYSNDIFKVNKLSDIWYLLRVFKNYYPQLLEGKKYRFINHYEDWSGHEIALNYALHDKVSSVVTGTTSLRHLKNNVEALNKVMPSDILKAIDAV